MFVGSSFLDCWFDRVDFWGVLPIIVECGVTAMLCNLYTVIYL